MARLLLIGFLLIAAALRIAGAVSDLWLDEIWSLNNTARLQSPAAILTSIHHDNNHHLNTAYQYAVGHNHSPLVYRLPAVLSGVLLISLIAMTLWKKNKVEAIIAAALLAFNYPLILYSSEARGYSLALLFAAAAVLLLMNSRRPATTRVILAFAACVILGMLSHLTCIFFYLVIAACTMKIPRLHIIPAAFLVFLYLTDIRWMHVGGGDKSPLHIVLADLLTYTWGLPSAGAFGVVAALIAAGLFAWIWKYTARTEFLLAAGILAVPVAVVLVTKPDFLAVRYFLFAVPVLLLMSTRALTALARHGRLGQVASAAILVLYTAGNALPAYDLIRYGRGEYRRAVADMAALTPGALTLGSDHEFRNRTVLDYYAPAFHYTDLAPEWFLTHDFNRGAITPATITVENACYSLYRRYPSAPLSGWNWNLYRRSCPSVQAQR